ncbi:unnamed protein product [Urochloa humidicola]
MIAPGPRPRHVGGCGGLYAGAVGSGRRRIGAQGCTKGGLGAGHRILLRGRPPVATSTSPYPPAPPPAGAKVCYPRDLQPTAHHDFSFCTPVMRSPQ